MRKLTVLLGSVAVLLGGVFVAPSPAQANTCAINAPLGEEVCAVVLGAEGAACRALRKVPCPR